MPEIPKQAQEAVFIASEKMPEDTPIVQGYDFNQGIDFSALLKSYKFMGFQATNLALAIEEINRMVIFFHTIDDSYW